jgi:hypothetical protein
VSTSSERFRETFRSFDFDVGWSASQSARADDAQDFVDLLSSLVLGEAAALNSLGRHSTRNREGLYAICRHIDEKFPVVSVELCILFKTGLQEIRNPTENNSLKMISRQTFNIQSLLTSDG